MTYTIVRVLRLIVACSGLVLALASCEKNDIGTLDLHGNAPYVSNPVITPESINIDALTPIAGSYAISAAVRVQVSDPDGLSDVQSVVAAVLRPSAESSFLNVTLQDNGKSPDSVAGDGMYTATVQFSLTRALAGSYRVQIRALSFSGLTGNTVEKSISVRRNNSPPRLSNLVAPDTIILPVGGSLTVPITVVAADSDGLADIQQVYFRSLTSSSPDFKFLLKDDGGTDPPGPPLFLASGDSVAGDGTYSILVPLKDGPTVRRTNAFAFQATDSFGDTSATLLHYLTVR